MNAAPRFVIVNDMDRPYERLVAEYIDGIGYCYMNRQSDEHLRSFDGMTPERPTSMEDFGFEISVGGKEAHFTQSYPNTATYSDQRPREWDGKTVFWLPLVGKVTRKGRFIRERDARKRRKVSA